MSLRDVSVRDLYKS